MGSFSKIKIVTIEQKADCIMPCMEWLGIFCTTRRPNERKKERNRNPNKRTSNHKRVSDANYPTQKYSDVSRMTIQEDAVLEALCEMTNIETEKALKIDKVTGKERKKLFQKFSKHQETEDLFNDENKMREFMRNITGNSKRDREINDGIERTSVRVSQSRISVGSVVSRNSFQSLNKIGTQNTQNSRINLEDELKMHREYRQKQISQQNVMHQSRGSKTSVATKKSPIKNIGPSDNRNRISEVTRESYSEYSE